MAKYDTLEVLEFALWLLTNGSKKDVVPHPHQLSEHVVVGRGDIVFSEI